MIRRTVIAALLLTPFAARAHQTRSGAAYLPECNPFVNAFSCNLLYCFSS